MCLPTHPQNNLSKVAAFLLFNKGDTLQTAASTDTDELQRRGTTLSLLCHLFNIFRTGREEANKSVTSPHQSFSIRVTPRISAPIAEASLPPYRPL